MSLLDIPSNPTVSAVDVSGETITLTLSGAISTTITTFVLTFTQSDSSSFITDAVGLKLADFSQAITHTTDDVAPTVSSGNVVTTTSIELVMSEPVYAAMTVAGGDFTIAGVTTNPDVSTVGVSGKTITLTLSTAISDSDTPTVTYVPGTNRITDLAGNELAAINTPQTITNNPTAPTDTMAPTISSGITTDAMTITLTVSETVSIPAGMTVAGGDFTIAGVTTPTTVSTVAVSGTTITLTLSPAITHSDMMPTVSYVPGTIRITNTAGNELAGFDDKMIENNLVPPVVVAPRTAADGTDSLTGYTPPDTYSLPANLTDCTDCCKDTRN